MPTQRQVGQFSEAWVAVDWVVKAGEDAARVGHAVAQELPRGIFSVV
jgi:hypothetical protein